MAWATTMMPTCQAGCAGVSVWRTLICSGRRTGRRRGLTSTSRPGEPPKSPDRRTCRRWCPRRRPLDPLPRQPGSTTPAGGRWSRFMALKRSLAMWMRSSRRLRLAWVIIMTLVWQAGCAEASARATSSRSDRRLGRRRGPSPAQKRPSYQHWRQARLSVLAHPRPAQRRLLLRLGSNSLAGGACCIIVIQQFPLAMWMTSLQVLQMGWVTTLTRP
mmetsp:Transcript_68519/g.185133  ORF Transcript_68519/g.185133 Transcript_68519/m.185133 type:complete len:216 (-) Transcript_68519:1052-1699(-)